MNNISPEDKGLCARLAKNKAIAAMLDDDKTEWQAVIEFQASLNESECFDYIEALRGINKSLNTATIEERVNYFIKAKMRK